VPSDARTAKACDADKMICERCGQAEMFRMHAVWRCPHCGYKTDCCGW
jgi:ribosomal protein L37AE/L43A